MVGAWLFLREQGIPSDRGFSWVSGFQASAFDYSEITDVKQKKQLFFDTLRPIVQKENRRLEQLRKRLQAWMKRIVTRIG